MSCFLCATDQTTVQVAWHNLVNCLVVCICLDFALRLIFSSSGFSLL